MAATDSRAGWKRNTNRCFVHENVLRAPNLSSFPSSSSSSKQQSDDRLGDAAHQSDHPLPDCMHQNQSPLEDPPPDLKWWFYYPQPNVGHQKGFEYEQLNTSESELDILSYEFINRAALEGLGTQIETKNADSFLDSSRKVSASSMKEDQFVRMCKPNAGLHYNPQNIDKDKDIEESWCMDEDLDTVNSLFSEQSEKLSSDLESQWMKAEKTEPWWRKADKDTLASMVAQSSVKHIENCDLPQPQTKHFRKGLSSSLDQSDPDDMATPSLDQMAELSFSNATDCTGKSHTSVSMDEKRLSLGCKGYSPNHSDALFRNNGQSVTGMDQEEACHIPKHVSKAQLVKALCHSQTRAREAEKAAQKAYEEKEHIIKLFFKQASQLFAYKQWLQLLQLENTPPEANNKDQPISHHVPTLLPWIPYNAQKCRMHQYWGAKKKRGSTTNGNGINKYAVAIALGLSLTGAGLLLGWTLGWLFPRLQTASSSRPASSSSMQNSDSGLAGTHDSWGPQIKGLTGTETPNDDDSGGADGRGSGEDGDGGGNGAIEFCAFDNRGMGQSSVPTKKSEYTTKIMAKDAIALMDHLGWRKAHIVGHSMGAMIACKLAAIVPDRVLSLALLNVTGGGFECFPKLDRKTLSIAIRFLKAKTPEQRAAVDLDTHYTEEYLEEFVGPNTRREILYQEYVKGISSTGMQSNHGFEGQINACWTHKMTNAELKLIRAAGFLISVIHGRYDVIAQVSHARRLAEKLQPFARMIELHGGHLVSHERTEEVNQALLELINASETMISPHDWTNWTEETSGCLVPWKSCGRTDADGESSRCFLFSILEKLYLCVLYLFGLFMLAQEHGRRALRRIKPVTFGVSAA